MKKTLAWIATLALLLTSMSSLATIFASAEGTRVLADFDGTHKVTVSADNAAFVNGELKHVTDGSKAEKLVLRLQGVPGDFNGSKITFDYRVEEKYNGSSLIGITCTKLQVVSAGVTYTLGTGSTNANFYFLANTADKLSGTHTINLAGLKTITTTNPKWSDMDLSQITDIRLYGNKTGTSGTDVQPAIYIDNITLHDPVSTADPEVRMLNNFGDTQLVTVTTNSGAGIANGVLSHTFGSYKNVVLKGEAGSFYGTGLYFTVNTTLNGAKAKAYSLKLKDSEGTLLYSKDDWEGGKLNFSFIDGKQFQYMPFPAGIDMATVATMELWTNQTAAGTGTATVEFDDFALYLPNELPKLSAEGVSGGVKATWSADDKGTVKVYTANHAITEDMLTDLAANGITEISAATDGTYTATGTAYFAMKEINRDGTNRFLTTEGLALWQDFNSVQNVGDVAYINNNMTSAIVGDADKKVEFSFAGAATDAYPYFGFKGEVGDFAGDGIQFTIKNTGENGVPNFQKFYIAYELADGTKGSHLIRNPGQTGGWSTFSMKDGVATLLYNTSLTSAGLTQEMIDGAYAIYGHTQTKNAFSFTVDNVCVINPRNVKVDKTAPEVTLSAEATSESIISVNASATDDEDANPTLSVYFSAEELNAGNIEEKIAAGTATVFTGEEATGLATNKQYWFAAKATDATGNESDYVFATATTLNQKLFTNFDNVQNAGDVAYINNNMQSALVGDADKQVEFSFVYSNNQYPWFGFKGEVGDFAGDGIQFTIQNTGENNVPGFVEFYLYYQLEDGTKGSHRIFYAGNPSGWSSFSMKDGVATLLYDTNRANTGITKEMIDGAYQIAGHADTKTAFSFTVDDVYVLNPRDAKAPVISLSAAEADQTVTLTTELGDATTSQLYWSESEITKENIESANVMQGTVLSGLKSGTTYYFALKAADEAGNVAYAFTSVKTTSKSVVIYDADEHSGTGIVGNNATVTVNNAVAGATGNAYQATLYRTQYPAIDFKGVAGDFAAAGFSAKLRAEITADEGKDAPVIRINGYTLFYNEMVDNGNGGQKQKTTYQYSGRTIPTDGTWLDWNITRYTNNSAGIPAEDIAKVEKLRINIEITNAANGDIKLYFDDVALIDPVTAYKADVAEKLEAGNSIFDLSNAEMNVAREEGLLADYAPVMQGATIYAKDGKFRGELGFIVTNPAKLDATMATDGYVFKAMGVLVMPEALVNGRTLVRGMADTLDITAEYVADGEDYSTYTAILGNSTDYALYQMCARAYAVYENEAGAQIVVYSDNDAAGTGVQDGVVTRSLNNVTRSFAKQCFEGKFGEPYKFLTVDGVQKPLKETLDWATSGKFEQAWAYAKEAYLHYFG